MKVYVLMAAWGSMHPLDYKCAGAYTNKADAEWANEANKKLVDKYYGYVEEVVVDYKVNEATAQAIEKLGMTVPEHLRG